MQEIVALACETCRRRNYTTARTKRPNREKMTFSKYCRFCRKHVPHREVKAS